MITIVKEIKAADKRGENLGLNDDEIAFYGALADNENAQQVLGDDNLREFYANTAIRRISNNWRRTIFCNKPNFSPMNGA